MTANAVEGLVKLIRRMTSGRSRGAWYLPSTMLAVIEGLRMRLGGVEQSVCLLSVTQQVYSKQYTLKGFFSIEDANSLSFVPSNTPVLWLRL